MIFLRFAISLFFILLGGRIFLQFLFRGLAVRRGERVALSFALGYGWLTLSMLFLSLLGIPLRLPFVLPCFLFSSLAGGFLFSRFQNLLQGESVPADAPVLESWRKGKKQEIAQKSESPSRKRIFMLLGGLFLLALILLLALRFHQAFNTPRAGDSLGIWGIKAKIFFFDEKVPLSFFTDSRWFYTHQDYPLSLPLGECWIHMCLGGWNDRWGMLLSPAFFFFLVIGLISFLRRWMRWEAALLFCLLFSINYSTYSHAGVSQADIPLAFFYGLGILLFMRWASCRSREGFLFLSGLLFGLGGWMKHEGSGYFLTFWLLLLFLFLLERGEAGWRRKVRRLLQFLLPGFLVLLPWIILRASLGLRNDLINMETLAPSNIFAGLARIKTIAHHFYSNLFFSRDWLLFWFLLIASTILTLKESLRRPLLYLVALLAGSFFFLAFLYVITPNDPNVHLLTSFRRITISLTVPAILLIAYQSVVFFHPDKFQKFRGGNSE